MNVFFTKFKTLSLMLIFGVTYLSAAAQSTIDVAPGVNQQTSTATNHIVITNQNSGNGETPFTGIGTPVTEAQWDIQFDYSVVDSTNATGGLAGALLVGTEFWVSEWNTDKLYRLTSTGSFIDSLFIDDGGTNVSGTRSLTTDGTNVYLGTASSTIYEVDPATFSVTGTITSQGATARFLTYDPTADGGAGGFWLANFSTDIELISRTGAVLATIPAATHGLTGMYGAAYDGISTGGPYLWVFAQSGGNGTGFIHQLLLPSGIEVGTPQNVVADVGAGAAGGLFITDQLVTGKNTLGGLLQGNSLFGYELDFVPTQIDAEIVASGHVPSLGQIPTRFIDGPFNFGGSIRNNGLTTITNVGVDLSVTLGGSSVHTDNATSTNLANLGIYNFSFPTFTPTAEGAYVATMTANTGAQTDEIPSNNSTDINFTITDSVLAMDDGIHAGAPGFGFGISSTSNGIMALRYDFPKNVYLKGVEIQLERPVNAHGQSLTGSVIFVSGNAPTGAPLLTSNSVLLDSNQTNYILEFSAELPITAGQSWAIGADENGTFVLPLSYSNQYFANDRVFFTTDDGTTWEKTEDFGIAIVPFIRPIIVSCKDFSLDLTSVSYNPVWNQQGSVEVTVNNGRGAMSIQWDDPNNSTTAVVGDLMDGTYTVTVTDANSCTATQSVDVKNTTAIEDDLAAGINTFKIYPNPTQGIVNLNIELSQVSDLSLELVDLNGRTVYTESRQKVNVYNNALNLSSLSKGVYMLQATTAQGRTFKRIILD